MCTDSSSAENRANDFESCTGLHMSVTVLYVVRLYLFMNCAVLIASEEENKIISSCAHFQIFLILLFSLCFVLHPIKSAIMFPNISFSSFYLAPPLCFQILSIKWQNLKYSKRCISSSINICHIVSESVISRGLECLVQVKWNSLFQLPSCTSFLSHSVLIPCLLPNIFYSKLQDNINMKYQLCCLLRYYPFFFRPHVRSVLYNCTQYCLLV